MKFSVYSGKLASNYSVNITCHGSFNAKSEKESIKLIELNKKYQYCQAWQFPFDLKDKRIPCLHDNFKWKLFICLGEPLQRNVIWKHSEAIISYFEQKSS